MKENMKITVETFLALIGVFYITTSVMVFIIAYQAARLSVRPVSVPVTSIQINGESHEGRIWSDGNVYAILNGDTLLFVADNQDAILASVEDWMQMSKNTRAEVKRIIVDESITSIDAYALGTISFKNLEVFCAEGHLDKVGAYALAWLPQESEIDFAGGVGEFEMNSVHDHDPETIAGANPGPDALHYYPFR